MRKDDISLKDIIYTGSKIITKPKNDKSIEVIALDTESYKDGTCFMVCTSLGDIFKADEFPDFLFTRKYIGCNFVTYNIKYDEGSFVQHLPVENLRQLWKEGQTVYKNTSYKSIPKKLLMIGRNNKYAKIYDIAQFYQMSLNAAALKYLGKAKIDIDTNNFVRYWVKMNWDKIGRYCIQDCKLTQSLADRFIATCERLDVKPRRLYSTAYISFQYFKSKCDIPTVKSLYDYMPDVLQFAMNSYNGGKFEVTQKGTGYYYEYDIVSAYPYEIANLIDISKCRVMRSKTFQHQAIYGFLDCTMKIPYKCFSPIALKDKGVAIYPIGEFRKTITKNEYQYLIDHGTDIYIHDAYWMITDDIVYPFRDEIERIVSYKTDFKKRGLRMEYQLTKILMNSLYGKFVQLIYKRDKFYAGINWNPIYGTVITANCRITISRYQQQYKSVIAVHTDSIISNKKLNIPETNTLGCMSYECEGDGIIIGSGIYQIGNKTRLRGFDVQEDLFKLLDKNSKSVKIFKTRPRSWREVIFHNWDKKRINRFEKDIKRITIDFDTKRIWIDDWKTCKDALMRNVFSTPRFYSGRFGFL